MESSEKRRKTSKNLKSDSNSDNNNHKRVNHKQDPENKTKDLITIIDKFISKHIDIIFLVSLIFTIVFGILLFNNIPMFDFFLGCHPFKFSIIYI